MHVLSVHEVSGIKNYILEDNEKEYIAEQLFPEKMPRSRIIADIKRNIEDIIKRRNEFIEHPAYIKYQDLEQLEGQYCLIREGEEIFTPMAVYLQENDLTLEKVVEWMLSIAEIGLQLENNKENWQCMIIDSLWVDSEGRLKLMDPDIAMQVTRYRELDIIDPAEVYRAPEIFRNEIKDNQSLIYSTGIIMYFLITGNVPYIDNKDAGIDKSDLVHEILTSDPVEPIYLNPKVSPALNDFIMNSISTDKNDRIKSWDFFIKQLKSVKGSGIEATEEEEREYSLKAEKIIRTSSRKKGLSNFWRRRWKTIAVVFSVFILVYLISTTGGRQPVITAETSPEQVVLYFYQSIDDKDTALLEETHTLDLKRLESMVTETYVLERMRQAYQYQGEEDEGLFGIKNLSIEQLSGEPEPVFEAQYVFYYNIEEEPEDTNGYSTQEEAGFTHYELNMTDKLELELIDGIWRIVGISVGLENIMEGRVLEPLEE
ncbi:MAG: protein kinase domain-containing protein [Halanaerobiales bacterium]